MSTRPNNATDANGVEHDVASDHSSRNRSEDSSRNRIHNRGNGSRSYSMGNMLTCADALAGANIATPKRVTAIE
jgi:hypothetical protein